MLTGNGCSAKAFRVMLAVVMGAVWCGLADYANVALAQQAAGADKAARVKQATERLERLFKALEAAVKDIPRDTFDPQAVVDKVGKDPQKLFEFVRDNTYWVPYRGALRGPVGVLMDRTGNSLDRALLLAELLQRGGQTVRLARAELSRATAEQWLAKVNTPPAEPPPEAMSTDDVMAKLETVAGKFELDIQELRRIFLSMQTGSEKLANDVTQRATEQAKALLAGLDRPAADAGTSAARRVAISEHWWVQRLDKDKWSDMDPLLGDAKPGATAIAPNEIIRLPKADGKVHLDAKYCHEVEVRVVVEQRSGGALTERIALRHTLRPSDLFGQTVSLQHVPRNWSKDLDLSKGSDPMERLRAEAARQTEWLPVLSVGAKQIEGSVIHTNGQVKASRGAGPAAVAPMGGFGGLLGGGQDERVADGELTAEWIDYVIRAPGAGPRTIRREFFDLLGPAARADAKPPAAQLTNERGQERALAFLDRVDVLVQVSRYAPEYVLHAGLAKLLAEQRFLMGLVKRDRRDPQDGLEAMDRLIPESAALLNLAVCRFTRRVGSRAVYLDCPNILNARFGVRFTAKEGAVIQESFDVVSNTVAPWWHASPAPKGGAPRPSDAFETQVRQGVLDTVLEGALLADETGSHSAPAFFAAAGAQGIRPVTVRAGDVAALARMDLPRDVACRAQAALRDGYHLVLPARAVTVDGTPRLCWWRVSARSGETIGVLDSGFHQATGDYAATLKVGVVRGIARQATKGAAKWVAKRGVQFYNGWQAPPYMGSLIWDWGKVTVFAAMGLALATGVGAAVWYFCTGDE